MTGPLNRIVDDNEAWMRPNGAGIEIYDAFQSGAKLEWRKEHGLILFKTKGTLTPPTFDGAHYSAGDMTSQVYEDVKDDPQFFDGAESMMIMLACTKDGLGIMPSGYLSSGAAWENWMLTRSCSRKRADGLSARES